MRIFMMVYLLLDLITFFSRPDDDGPFYSYKATLGGFELWKRNSNVQIGAMARKLDLGPRQTDESNMVVDEPADQFFVSQCPTDEIHYNYNTFTNFHARMVLPSGSFLREWCICDNRPQE